MALREFRDANGVEWRVWATIPAATEVVRIVVGTLGTLDGGWLTFECAEGRRRLAPFPADWDSLSDAELERCCADAKAPPPRRSRRPDEGVPGQGGASRGEMEVTTLDPATPARTFTGPSGRLWRVTEHEMPVRADVGATGATGSRFVLRFTAGTDMLELDEYPMAWARLADAQLARLARQAALVRRD